MWNRPRETAMNWNQSNLYKQFRLSYRFKGLLAPFSAFQYLRRCDSLTSLFHF